MPKVEYLKREPNQWLPPVQRGNLFHHVLDHYIEEVFAKNAAASFDEDTLKKIFEKEMEEMKSIQPCPSQAIFEAEKEENWECICRYIQGLHAELQTSDKEKKIIGGEVEFRNVPYSGGAIYPDEHGNPTKDRRYELCFVGSADLVKGYVESGVLYLEIIDYKTGSMKKKKKEVDNGSQVQHYVYAICMKQWVKEHLKELKELFGQEISDCKIASMDYVFPFEEGDAKIPVSETVTEDDLKLPVMADGTLQLTVGELQHGQLASALTFMDGYAGERIQEALNQKEDFCEYCSYQNVCRKKI